jgi:hypothetical protein
VNLCRRLAALLVLALGGCAQVVTGQGQAASAPYSRTSDPAGFFDTPVEKSGLFSETGNKRTAAPQLTIGTLLYLVSLGMVAAATVGAFFGIGFLLLAHPKEEPIAGAGTRDFGAEVSPWRSSLLPRPDNAASPPPETELPDPTAAAAHRSPRPKACQRGRS